MIKNFILLTILSSIWGSSFFAIKIAVVSIHPFAIASLRLIIASIVLIIYFKIKKMKFNLNFKLLLIICFIGVIGNFLPFVFISWSEKFIQSNTAGLLMSVGPIFALILTHFLIKNDKFNYFKLISVILGLIGVLFIFEFNIFQKFYFDNSTLIPKILIIVSVLGYVFSSILAYNIEKVNILTLTTYVTLSAAIFSLPFLIFTELYRLNSYNLDSVIPIIYLGIFPTALAFLLRFKIIAEAGPMFLSYVSYLIPFFAIFWGYIFLDERVSLNAFIGLILIIIGIFLGQFKKNSTII
ncbi:MAG: hypothetical protein CFH19_00478 [Alphaproteobacteria bacterium MarineAlpha5_Bin9]|nr:MAG: hypothetical protein CFH19_00478 [Alphaproteobacteria bacterium MarineAlpha5_Bin9]